MILIGQYDSPFVRRVGIALILYALPFRHETWSAFGDSAKLQEVNPLMRVPTLVLDDGTVLVDSHCMLDYLDSLVPDEKVMFPRREPARHQALRIATLATGLGDKAVSLFYEKRLHKDVSQVWAERCRSQMFAALAVLETERGKGTGDYWFDARIGHADVAVATILRFIGEAHPGLGAMADYPRLRKHAAFLEELPAFRTISQAFVPPA
jgi:glutathione S-transferase